MRGWKKVLGSQALEYREGHRRLLDLVGTRWQKSHVVDSSKTAYSNAYRPFALHQLCGLDVRVIHLVRDPAKVLASCLRGRNRVLALGEASPRRFEVAITLAGWNQANRVACKIPRVVGKSRYLRLDLDTLLRTPDLALQRIGRLVGLDMSPVLHHLLHGKLIPQAHLIGGNRMARSAAVTMKFDTDDFRPQLDAIPRLAVRTFAEPLYRRLCRA